MSLAGWKYYSDIVINNSNDTDLTDYQVKITLDSSNFDFSKANSDGSDIRFSEDGRTTIPYWIESWDSASQKTIIWIKVSSISANSSKKIRMYYGNENAVSESNGDNTFELFDDFEGTSLDTNKWTVPDGSIGISNSEITISGLKGRIRSINTFTQPLKVRAKAKYTDTNKYHHGYIAYLTTSDFVWEADDSGELDSGNGYFISINSNYYDEIESLGKMSSGTTSYSNGTVSGDSTVYHLWQEENHGGALKQILDDGVEILTLSDTDYSNGYVVLGRRKADSLVVDWVFISNYIDPEPTYTIGATRANTNALFFANNF